MNKSIQEQIELYTNGLSTYEVAKITGLRPSTIRSNIRRYGLMRTRWELETEEEVAKWFESLDSTVERQPGDAPFDMKVYGRRIDVKTAHKNIDGRYTFKLKYGQSLHKKTIEDLDALLLVFMDIAKKPMFLVEFEDVQHLSGLALKLESPKYPMQFLGYLDRSVK